MDKNILHNAEELWEKYATDCMTDAERIAFLEQALDDEESLEKLASLELVKLPGYLEEEILERVIAEDSSETSLQKHFQLFIYSAKITFAAACAIVALFHMPDLSELGKTAEPAKVQWELEAAERAREKRESARESSKADSERESRLQENRQGNRQNTSYVAEAFEFLSKIIYDGGTQND